MDEVNFDAYNDEDEIELNKTKSRSPRSADGAGRTRDALEIVIKKQQCTEIGCFTQTHNQCIYCRQFKCDIHVKNICIFGPYCMYCHKRKWYIIIGSIICVAIAIALIFWLMYMLGVY